MGLDLKGLRVDSKCENILSQQIFFCDNNLNCKFYMWGGGQKVKEKFFSIPFFQTKKNGEKRKI